MKHNTWEGLESGVTRLAARREGETPSPQKGPPLAWNVLGGLKTRTGQ